MNVGKPLGKYVEGQFFRGVTSGLNDAFIINSDTRKALIRKNKASEGLINRYWVVRMFDATSLKILVRGSFLPGEVLISIAIRLFVNI